MPNHITNRVEIKGTPTLIKQIKDFLGEEMDFEKILPTPEEINSEHTISPTPDPDSPKNVALRKKYGADNWFDWQINHWGVKWGAYDHLPTITENNRLEYEFHTAWNMPEGIARYLAKKFPKAQIVWHYADEDLGNNCGIAIFENGELAEFINKEGRHRMV